MEILIVEDDEVLLQEVSEPLSAEGFGIELIRFIPQALRAIATTHYDIIIINITSFNREEMELLRFMKTTQLLERTIITYSPGLTVSSNKIDALGVASLPKPYSASLLHAQIVTMFRLEHANRKSMLFYNELVMDVPGRNVKVKDLFLHLTRSEFDLLHLFITNKTKVLTKVNLAQLIAKDEEETPADYSFLYTHIKNLKKKLKSAGCHDYIQTVYGIGYRFNR